MEQRVADALDRSKPCLPSLVSQIVTTTGHVLPNWGNVGPGHEHIVRAQSLPPVFDPATTTDSATATPTPVSTVVARPAPRLLRPVPDALPLPAELVQEVQQWDARMAADGAYLRSVGQVASQAPEATAAALRRLHLILDTFYPAELFERGSYVDTLTFVAFDTSRFQGIPAQFLGEMLDFLYRGGRVIDYERLLAPWVRQLMPPFQPAQLAHYPKLSGKLDQLDLDRISKRVLGENIERALGGARLRQSKQTENQQGHEEVANQLRVLEAQLRALRRQLEIPEHKDLIQVALNLASYSPMAGLRTLRLLDIVQRHDADAVTVKLRELGDPQAVMVGMGYGPRPPLPAEIAGTQWAGYFTDPHIVRLFRGYHLHTAEALSLERTAQRRAQRDKALTAFWQGRDPRRPLSRQDLVHSLRLLKDPWSTETAQKIESGELPTEILYPTEFETEIKSERFNFKPNQLALHHPERWTAAYAPPQTPGGKGAMLLRQPNYPNASSDPAELNARLARWQSSAIHEGGFHDGHIQALSVEKRTPGVVLRHEVYAHGGQRLWQAYHGDLSGLDLMNLGTQGLAMFVRNDVERVEFPRKPSESS